VANRVIALIWYQVAGDLALYLVKRVVVWDIGGAVVFLVLLKSVVAVTVCAARIGSSFAERIFFMSQGWVLLVHVF